jgi:hypothetical protein
MDYFRPWMFVITDGKPTDQNWEAAAALVKEEARKGVTFYGVGVENGDLAVLAKFSDARQPLKLKGLAFGDCSNGCPRAWRWLPFPPRRAGPAAPVGWGQVDTSHS